MKNDPRDTYQWQKLRAQFKDRCRRSNALCHLCVARGDVEHAVIDYGAARYAAWSFEPDHVKPVETHPQLALMESNLAPSHSRCNRQRRDEMMKAVASVTTEWVKPNF